MPRGEATAGSAASRSESWKVCRGRPDEPCRSHGSARICWTPGRLLYTCRPHPGLHTQERPCPGPMNAPCDCPDRSRQRRCLMALSKSARRERGLAILEMALILPLLFLLCLGVIEYGWLFFKNQQVAAAARNACRYGITEAATTALTLAKVDTEMTQAGLGSSGYTKTSTPVEVIAGTFVTVTVTV